MRSLSSRAEFLLVIAVAFGYFILSSLFVAFTPAAAQGTFTEGGLAWLIGFEVVVGAALAAGLAMRGWTAGDLGLRFAKRDLAGGALLVLVAWASSAALAIAMQSIAGPAGSPSGGHSAAPIGLAAILAVSVVNPLFEEVFVCAYVIRALQCTRSTAFAVNASVAIRVSYHLYQVGVGAVSIIPIGLVFGAWFARSGRLWPAVIAHGVFDAVGLALLAAPASG